MSLLKCYRAKNPFKAAEDKRRQIEAEKDQAAVLTAFHTIFFLSTREKPLSNYEDEVRFLAFKGDQGAKDLCKTPRAFKGDNKTKAKLGKVKYAHHESTRKIMLSIASVMEDEICNEIRKCGPYAIIIDESTDISVQKTLAICVRYFTCDGITTKFLVNLPIVHGDAKTITLGIKKYLDGKKLPLQNMVGLASDGASVMMGSHSGVGKRFRDGWTDDDLEIPPMAPYLIHIHCVAHRLNLCISQAAKSMFHDAQETICMAYNFFRNSSERTQKLDDIETLLDDTPNLKLKEPINIRWLSLGEAVRTFYRIWNAVVMALESEAESGTSKAKALGILKRVKSYRFIATLVMLSDVLPVVSALSKRFQADSITYNKARGFLAIAKGKIQGLLENEGETERAFKNDIERCDAENDKTLYLYRGVEIADMTSLQAKFQRDRQQFINNLLDNLEQRFPLTFEPVMEAHSSLIATGEVQDSDSIMDNLLQFYGDDHEGNADPLIDVPKTREEWNDVMHLLPMIKGSGKTTEEWIVEFVKVYSGDFPNMALLLKISQIIPVASVSCERAFSCQNRIKSKFRSRLNNSTLQGLMVVATSSHDLESFDFNKAIRQWSKSAEDPESEPEPEHAVVVTIDSESDDMADDHGGSDYDTDKSQDTEQ